MSNIMELIDDYANCCQADGAHDLIDDHETTVAARTAVVEAVEKLERDAARYRWLSEQNADLEAGFYVGDETDALPEDITWVGSDLDAADIYEGVK